MRIFQFSFFSLFSILGLTVLLLSAFQSLPVMAGSDKLIMFDSRHCPSCIKFKREMASRYWKSDLGKQLPLSIVRSGNRRAMARYEGKVDPISFTPTFVLISDGQEVARSIGYSSRAKFLSEVERMRRHWNN